MTAMKNIDAREAARLSEAGALLVDVRETSEYASAHIPGSANVPLSHLEAADLGANDGQAVVFFCASGGRTRMHAARLQNKANGTKAYVMDGGIAAWGQAGLPVERSQAAGGGFFSRVLGR